MSKVKVQGMSFYYLMQGEGYPLILIRGLGSNADHWYEQIPDFSSRYRVVAFDNRGIGRSDDNGEDFTIQTMAADTVGIMEALEIPRAHILGLSMGGMIAQEVAIQYPERVNGLVLACTHCGGDHAVRASDEIGSLMGEYVTTGTPEAAQKAAKCFFADTTLQKAPDLVQKYQEVSRAYPRSPDIMMRQWKAIQKHDTWEALPRIQGPTLVLTGKEDVLIPPENSEILAGRIPHASLQVMEGGGHQFLVEQAAACNKAVMAFLDALPPS